MKKLHHKHNSKSFLTLLQMVIQEYTIGQFTQHIQLTIQDNFNNYMNKLIEFNGNSDTPINRPSI